MMTPYEAAVGSAVVDGDRDFSVDVAVHAMQSPSSLSPTPTTITEYCSLRARP